MNWQTWKHLFVAENTPTKVDPFSLGEWEQPQGIDEPQMVQSMPEMISVGTKGRLSSDLAANLAWLEQRFDLPRNAGIAVRRFGLVKGRIPAAIVYIDDQVDWEHLNHTTVAPLIDKEFPPEVARDAEALIRLVLTEGRITATADWAKVENAILTGWAVLFVGGLNKAVMVEARGWAKRQPERPTAEIVVRGPQEAFTEDIRTNLSMVRRRLRTPDLIAEWTQIGSVSRTDVVLLYLRNVTNPKLTAEVRRRLVDLKVDYVADSGTLEQLIEDHPFSPHPTVLHTERPDRVAAQVAEGFVALLVANDPFALIMPAMLPMFLQTAEDVYLRWPFGSFLRGVRLVSFGMAELLPALYVAVANFHHEMIPTPLMMAITSARETVPLPTVLEVWFMESMFELIREAGVRVPSVIGPTIGIVGALILGQAAVQAGIISPIMVIITSATALASFAVPNYSMQFSGRVMRFIYILAAAMFGLVGITLLFIVVLTNAAGNNTFGVPRLAPLTPARRKDDAIARSSAWKQESRPPSVRPQDSQREEKVVRPWSPGAPQDQNGGDGNE